MKRILSLLLTIATIGAVLTLSSCSLTPNNPAETTTPNTTAPTAETTANTSDTEHNYFSEIPIENFENKDFNILTRYITWSLNNMTAEGITGDTIQDAIYERQLAVEDRLKINIVENMVQSSDVMNRIMIDTNSGAGEIDLAVLPTGNALTLYNQHSVHDISTLDNINLDNPWWEQSFNEKVNIGSKRYIVFGQANLTYYCSYYLYAFNKSLFENYSLENPYDLVKSNTWTWDKMYEIMQEAKDMNGDGVFDPANDILGFTLHVNHPRNLILSSGFYLAETNSDGYPEFNGLSENYINAFTKFTQYFITSPYTAVSGASPNRYEGYSGGYEGAFMEGHSLFLCTTTQQISICREGELAYGIVVLPKYDAAQPNFITPVYSATEGFVIPTSVDSDRSALVLETLGLYSYNNLVDKQRYSVLHYKYAQNPTDIQMIELAYSNGAIDVSMANNFGTCANILNNLNTYGSTGIQSVFASITKKFQSDIKAAIGG